MYIGYHILKVIRKKDKVSIYEVAKELKAAGMGGSRQLILGLTFLYSVGIIEFEEAMIWVKR